MFFPPSMRLDYHSTRELGESWSTHIWLSKGMGFDREGRGQCKNLVGSLGSCMRMLGVTADQSGKKLLQR